MCLERIERYLFDLSVGGFIQRAVDDLSGELDRQKFKGVVFGASGGIDSLVSAALCQRARQRGFQWPLVGLQMVDSRVKGELYNPDLYTDLKVDLMQIPMTSDALQAEKRLGLPPRWLTVCLTKWALRWIPVSPRRRLIGMAMAGDLPEWARLHYRHLTLLHQLRIVKLKDFAARHALMIMVCANRTEASLGYFVEQGVDDPHMGDWAPIVELYKSQVRAVARFLGLPERAIRQKPSPGFGGIYDEEIIGPYGLADLVLAGIHLGYSDTKITKAIRDYVLKGPNNKHLFSSERLFGLRYVRFLRRLVELNAQKQGSNPRPRP
jgi:NAD+ synthase